MQVIDHERRRLFECAKVGEQLLDERLTVEARGRIEPLDDPAGIRERGVHDQPEPLRVMLVALDRHPADPIFQPRGLDPGAYEHRLAAPGGRTDERHPAGRGGGEAIEQHPAPYHACSPRSRVCVPHRWRFPMSLGAR